MTGHEVGQILKAIEKLDEKVEKNHSLLVGNGDERAVIPRLQALEFFVKAAKLLSPIIIAVITGGVMYAIFGSP